MSETAAYGDSWRAEAQLGGRDVLFRLLTPGDRPLIAEGFHELSAAGRYQRFLSSKERLSSAELDYLCEVNQQTHVAIGAVEQLDGAEGRGLGVARFIRDRDDPQVAEAAVTVIDDAQGIGLGRALFGHLVGAARDRGVARFRGELLADNEAALRLIEGVGAPLSKVIESGITQIEVELDGAGDAGSKGYELLKLVAGKKLRIRRFLNWLDDWAKP